MNPAHPEFDEPQVTEDLTEAALERMLAKIRAEGTVLSSDAKTYFFHCAPTGEFKMTPISDEDFYLPVQVT